MWKAEACNKLMGSISALLQIGNCCGRGELLTAPCSIWPYRDLNLKTSASETNALRLDQLAGCKETILFLSKTIISNYFCMCRDNYAFVTFHNTADAYKAIEHGNEGEEEVFDLCFGGRRQFCQTSYADLGKFFFVFYVFLFFFCVE